MTQRMPVTEADLNAYVDDQLPRRRRREVEAYLQANPEAAAAVEDYRRIGQGLHELYAPVLDEAVPARLAVTRPRRPRLLPAALAAWVGLGFSFGGAIGWTLHAVTASVQLRVGPLKEDLLQPAAFAHVVYTAEVRHPVEVTAEHEQHLVAWLSQRLHADIRAPNLLEQGFRLVGGRLLPSTNRMAAQFMYERADGLRITLYIRHGTWGDRDIGFQIKREGNLGLVYWIDESLGYALIAELEHDELLGLSEAIHRQLSGDRGAGGKPALQSLGMF